MYNLTLNRICKPLYKIGIILIKIAFIGLFFGILIVIFNHGWLVTILSLISLILGIIFCNIPNLYLTGFYKFYNNKISAKEATKKVQKHLREPGWDDSTFFIMDIMIQNEI